MKNFKYLLCVISIILLHFLSVNFTSVYSQHKVLPADKLKNHSGNDGLYYSLPRTVIRVKVHVIQTENFKGSYSAFAKEYLGIEDVIQYNSKIFEINNIEICAFTESDPNQIYFIQIPDEDSKKDKEISVTLSKSGMIQAVNDEFINASISSISCKKVFVDTSDFDKKIRNKDVFKQFITSNYIEVFDTIIRAVIIDDTTTIEEKVFQSKLVEKTIEQKAAELTKKILEIQSDRKNLLNGYQEVAYSKESLEYMNDQLKNMEDDMVDLFKGVSIQSDLYYSYKYIPISKKPSETDVIFKFSPSSGVLDKSAVEGDAVKLIFSHSGVAARINETLGQSAIVNDEGFFYRFPEYSDVKVEYKDTKLSEIRLLIEQYGSLIKLPPNKSKILYHRNSGNIKRFEVE